MITRIHVSVLACVVALASAATAMVPGTELYVPSVGHGLGQDVNGVRAQWRADVWLYNPSSSQAAAVDVYFLARNQANPSPASRRWTVAAGETRYLADIVFAEFGLDNAYGALRVISTFPIYVTGRSYDANVTVEKKDRGVGSAGQFFAGLPAASAIGIGDTVDVVGLDQDGASTSGTWRSNLALVETTGSSVGLELQRFDANGASLGTHSYTLQGREARQIDQVLTAVFPSVGTNQRVQVRVTGGQGKVLVSASRIDNRTGDPSTIEMAGSGRDGTYLCKLDKTTYDTPVNLTVAGGLVTAIEAVILVTDEDSSSACAGGELLRLNQTLSPPVVLEDEGLFSFVVSGTTGAITVTLQLAGRITQNQVRGTGVTTVTGAGACSGVKTWPLVGARL